MISKLELTSTSGHLNFRLSALRFSQTNIENTFSKKNNKTLGETLQSTRYKKLNAHFEDLSNESMERPLGVFLLSLKSREDTLYKKFLNPYGDEVFCQFKMAVESHKSLKGLYLYCCDDEVMYIGRSLDPFGKRVDQGYGKIHPKNCYLDGQSTNCHINSLIATHQSSITFFVCPLLDDETIKQAERELIENLKPAWNIALKPDQRQRKGQHE